MLGDRDSGLLEESEMDKIRELYTPNITPIYRRVVSMFFFIIPI